MAKEAWIEEVNLANRTKDELEYFGRSHAGMSHAEDNWCVAKVLGIFDLVLDTRDTSLTPHLAGGGYWESWITQWVCANVTEDHLFIDVGANCGYYTMLAETLGASVIACEPNPVYTDLLRSTRDLNKAGFLIVDKAIADWTGVTTLSIPDTLHGSASIAINFDGTQYPHTNVEVSTTTLDDVAKYFNRPTVVKIDAEGAEESVWLGMQKVITSQWVILMEYTPNAYSEFFLDELFEKTDVSLLNYQGAEESVSKDQILVATDWITLVIRNVRK